MDTLLAPAPPHPPHFFKYRPRINPHTMAVANNAPPSFNRKRKAEDDDDDDDVQNPDNNSNGPHPDPGHQHDPMTPISPSHSSNNPDSTNITTLRSPFRGAKRFRSNVSSRPLSLPRLLETLDAEGLRTIIRSLTSRQPQLATEIIETTARPSVAAALNVLDKYHASLQVSFPLGGNSGSEYAYNRVRPHIVKLLDALNDFTPHFLPPNEPNTSTSLDYLDGATEIVHRLPRWDSPQHNLFKKFAYEDIARAWVLVIREAGKRAAGMHLQYGGWDQKLAKHNEVSGGQLQIAVQELDRGVLGWMGRGGHSDTSVSSNAGSVLGDAASVRQQLLSGTYGVGVPQKPVPW